MENPAEEIARVVHLITTAISPDIQRAAFLRYHTPDCGFRHPICSISPGTKSRENVLGVYQWYRVMSPHIDLEVKHVVHDPTRDILLLDVVQLFHIRFSPFKPAPARLLVRITLRQKDDGLWYIALQEDFYHPDDFLALLLPPLSPIIQFVLFAAGLMSHLFASIAQVLGVWRLSDVKID